MVRGGLGGERARTYSAILATDMATERPASDQASQAAARVLIPPLLPSWRFDPSVTTPLYSATVSKALRSSFSEQSRTKLSKTNLPKR
jgi:hypothetical protein